MRARARVLFTSLCVISSFSVLGTGSAAAQELVAPGPPESGPGSVADPAIGLDFTGPVRLWPFFGLPAARYYKIEPVGGASQGVLAYIPGGAGFTRDLPPSGVVDMLSNYARKGYLVLFVVHDPLTAPFSTTLSTSALNRAERSVRRSINHALGGDTSVPLAVVGHSTGAMLALRLARVPGSGPAIPPVLATIAHDPVDGTIQGFSAAIAQTLPDIGGLTLLIQSEQSAANPDSPLPLFVDRMTAEVPAELWNVLRVQSDPRPTPPLVSDHNASQSGEGIFLFLPFDFGPPDTIDYRGYWRPTEAAILTAFEQPPIGYDVFCSTADAVCDPARDMGQLSDGSPVNPILNLGDLRALGEF